MAGSSSTMVTSIAQRFTACLRSASGNVSRRVLTKTEKKGSPLRMSRQRFVRGVTLFESVLGSSRNFSQPVGRPFSPMRERRRRLATERCRRISADVDHPCQPHWPPNNHIVTVKHAFLTPLSEQSRQRHEAPSFHDSLVACVIIQFRLR